MALVLVAADAERRAPLVAALRAAGHQISEAEPAAAPAAADVALVIGPAEVLVQTGRDVARVLLSDEPAAEAARSAIECDAYDWLASSSDPARVVFVVRCALDAHARTREARRAANLVHDEEIAGSSALAAELRRAVERAAASEGPVLLSGPSGAILERVARAVHARSARRRGPFLGLACGALPARFAEAELADRIAEAVAGTLFLDEVDLLAIEPQARVLDALDRGTRVIASCSRDLASLVAADRFRPDLAARLGERTIVVPPLRARLDDIPALVERYLAAHRRGSGAEIPAVSDDALARLAEHDWPGDVRELETVLERALALARGAVLTAADLPFGERPAERPEQGAERSFFKASVARFERDLIMRALREAGGNRSRAAELLGIYRRLLYAKIKEYGLDGYPRKAH